MLLASSEGHNPWWQTVKPFFKVNEVVIEVLLTLKFLFQDAAIEDLLNCAPAWSIART